MISLDFVAAGDAFYVSTTADDLCDTRLNMGFVASNYLPDVDFLPGLEVSLFAQTSLILKEIAKQICGFRSQDSNT